MMSNIKKISKILREFTKQYNELFLWNKFEAVKRVNAKLTIDQLKMLNTLCMSGLSTNKILVNWLKANGVDLPK